MISLLLLVSIQFQQNVCWSLRHSRYHAVINVILVTHAIQGIIYSISIYTTLLLLLLLILYKWQSVLVIINLKGFS